MSSNNPTPEHQWDPLDDFVKKRALGRRPVSKDVIISGVIFRIMIVRHQCTKQLLSFQNVAINESVAGR